MLTFNLDSNSKTPLYEQLYYRIRNELETSPILPPDIHATATAAMVQEAATMQQENRLLYLIIHLTAIRKQQ